MNVLARKFCSCIAATVLAMYAGVSQGYESTLFYTVGHQDDWQLFMNPNAFFDAHVPDAKVVFIYMTAGDANEGTTPAEGGRIPYYLARESGAIAAAQFIGTPPGEFQARTDLRRVPINGHSIYKVLYNNTVSYFLRLPDGFPKGDGPSGSLQRLYNYQIPDLTDIEHRNTYTTEDLIQTLRAIVMEEARGSSNVWANIPNRNGIPGNGRMDDTDLYPSELEDHSDHIYSGRFMYEAIKPISCINWAEFKGYQTGWDTVAPNLTQEQLIQEAGTWGATVSGLLIQRSARNTFNAGHNKYLGKNYFDAYGGHGPCSPSSF